MKNTNLKNFLIVWAISSTIAFLLLMSSLLSGWRKTYFERPYSLKEILNQFVTYPEMFFGATILLGLFFTIFIGGRWWKTPK